jgi:hypothetical protein
MVPERWLRTKVVPILKPRKDPELLDLYSPINLPCAHKVLEKMLCVRLDYWAEIYLVSMVFKGQYGVWPDWR